jgi:hypothetical protein
MISNSYPLWQLLSQLQRLGIRRNHAYTEIAMPWPMGAVECIRPSRKALQLPKKKFATPNCCR